MSTTVLALARRIEQSRGELAELFAKHKNDAGEYDMPVEVIEEVNRRNDELSTLVDQHKVLQRALTNLGPTPPVAPRPGLVQARDQDQHHGTIFAAYKSLPGIAESIQSKAWRSAEVPWGPFEELAERKSLLSNTGTIPEVVRSGHRVVYPIEPSSVTELYTAQPTTRTAEAWLEESAPTDGSAMIGEGGTYGESALAQVEVQVPVKKAGVLLPVTDEAYADTTYAPTWIEDRLRQQLRSLIEHQLINGDGTGNNVLGLRNLTGTLTQAKGTNPTPDAIKLAITKIWTTIWETPDYIVMHPNEYDDIRLLRTADGIYIFGSPSETAILRLWGLPIVQTTRYPAGTALVGRFAETVLFHRKGVEVSMTNSHGTMFAEGKVAIRADVRFGPAYYRKNGFCTVTGL